MTIDLDLCEAGTFYLTRSRSVTVILKGTGVSKFYRFMGKDGRWVWMKSRGTVIYNTNHEPQYVVCMNYVYT